MFHKVLEKVKSPINGEITIYTIFGFPRMSVGGLLQSGGVVADIWKKAAGKISNYQFLISNILILGLGCGTAAQIFAKKYPEAKIVGVDIDPVVINLGKKYFGLAKIPNLKIICQDAIAYINSKGNKEKFDLIAVDLYLGDKIPPKTESLSFLKGLRKLSDKNGIIIFNRLFWDQHKSQAEEFVKKAEKIFPRVELVRTVANLLVFCSQTD